MADLAPIIVFDAYGTLFDVDGAARQHADAVGASWSRLSEIWRAKQLEYTWVHAAMERPTSFHAVTVRALRFALAAVGLNAALAPALLESYRRLPAFPEVTDVIAELKLRGAKLAILSNGDPDMLDDLVGGAGLETAFDHLISTSTAERFKPAWQVYQLATQSLGAPPNSIIFVSSNRWDIAGTKAFGCQTFWINRRNAPDEYEDWKADRVGADLTALI